MLDHIAVIMEGDRIASVQRYHAVGSAARKWQNFPFYKTAHQAHTAY